MGTCTECAQGRYSESGFSVFADCLPCKYSQAMGVSMCIDCAAGKYKEVAGFVVCIDCARGRYSANTSARVCTNCSAGKYAEVTGVSLCIDCAVGKYSGLTASTNTSNCVSCIFIYLCHGKLTEHRLSLQSRLRRPPRQLYPLPGRQLQGYTGIPMGVWVWIILWTRGDSVHNVCG
jgi:hypothetical protein